MNTLIKELSSINYQYIKKHNLEKELFSLLTITQNSLFLEKLFLLDNTNQAYSRCVLFSNDDFEIVLITWNYECLPHNHGDSYGVIKVINGNLLHRQYIESNNNDNNLTLIKEDILKTDGLIFETPEMIHSLEPISVNTVTLHIYFKPICSMKVFNRENRSFFIAQKDKKACLDSNIIEVELSNFVKEKFTDILQTKNKTHNPYLCDIDIAYETASGLLDILIDDYLNNKSNSSKVILTAINNANYNNFVTPLYITNGIKEPFDSFTSPDKRTGYDYAINKNDRMKKFFYSEWWNWSMSLLLNYDNIQHPSEHKGNRFHVISPLPKDDKLRYISSSSGGGYFPVHNDATAYNDFTGELDFINTLSEYNTDINTISKKLDLDKHEILQQVLCKQYVRADVLSLVNVVGGKTSTFLTFPKELEKYLYSLGFTVENIIMLSKMPVAHFAGPADGIVSNFIANVKPPIDIDTENNIIATYINAAENRMKYVGNSMEEENIFNLFYKALQDVPKYKVILQEGDLLFIPNLSFKNQTNVMHGRNIIEDNDYCIKREGYEYPLRRYHIRQYMSSRNRTNQESFIEKNYKGNQWKYYQSI